MINNVQCAFVVHLDCIYFPYVIRISRHHHRISFTNSLPFGNWSCGVCRQKVDSNYGAYSCNNCADYYVHSRCALRSDLWDGEELEGVPEEPEINVEPFEVLADGLILHFSHVHPLELKISRVYDEEKFCQACILPIYEGYYYSCTDQCDFIFHKACANAPRKIYHPLNARPLTLKVVDDEYDDDKGYFECDACRNLCCGFVYEGWRRRYDFKLDVRCALVSEPFEYQGHEHPLFLALKPKDERLAKCQICQEKGCRILNCIECDYLICFRCATSPYKAMYKHDKHLLTFHGRNEAAADYSEWCDVCEHRIGKYGFYYSCDDCCTTLHARCLLGKDPYMKPGQTIYEELYFDILRNNTMSRPRCNNCLRRCTHKLLFKGDDLTCDF